MCLGKTASVRMRVSINLKNVPEALMHELISWPTAALFVTCSSRTHPARLPAFSISTSRRHMRTHVYNVSARVYSVGVLLKLLVCLSMRRCS